MTETSGQTIHEMSLDGLIPYSSSFCNLAESSLSDEAGDAVVLLVGLVLNHSLTGPVIAENEGGIFHEIESDDQTATHSLAT